MVAKSRKRKGAKVALIVHDETPVPEALKPQRQTMTAAERRNWFRKQAGWPELRES